MKLEFSDIYENKNGEKQVDLWLLKDGIKAFLIYNEDTKCWVLWDNEMQVDVDYFDDLEETKQTIREELE